jgi:hypothetical protein
MRITMQRCSAAGAPGCSESSPDVDCVPENIISGLARDAYIEHPRILVPKPIDDLIALGPCSERLAILVVNGGRIDPRQGKDPFKCR